MPTNPKHSATIWRALLFAFVIAFDALALGVGDEFEGRYRVGPTTCSVTPIKMAFEIRWARGVGSMLYFYEPNSRYGRYVFVSEKKHDGFDRFVFTDERLASGVFIRSDGVRYPLARLDDDP